MIPFKTNNLYLASFIYSCGLEPTLESERPNQLVFSFPAGPELDRLILNFNNNVTIPVLDFSSAIKTVRGRMNSMKYPVRQGA
jgi:hypothetical protein